MDMLILQKDMKDRKGNVLLKAGTPYMPKGEDEIYGRKYLVYDSEIEDEEVLIPIN